MRVRYRGDIGETYERRRNREEQTERNRQRGTDRGEQTERREGGEETEE